MSLLSYISDNLTEWALLATWLIVIPYIVMFPPKLARLRRRLKSQHEASLVRSMKVKPEWRASTAVAAAVVECVVPRGAKSVLVFVNRRSGGQVGGMLVHGFTKLLTEAQVVDVSEIDPKAALAAFAKSHATSLRVLVAGGDGTVSWVMGAAEELGCRFPIAILPLGTGNDLARSLYWGSGFSESDATLARLQSHLALVAAAEAVHMDRWIVRISDRAGDRTQMMNNYISWGVDAEISMKFHQERQLHPERFTSQQHNVMKYAFYGLEGSFESAPLGTSAQAFRLDGTAIDVNPLWKGVIVSNIPCYHGGKNFWGDGVGSSGVPQSMSDGLLEVMGVAGTLHIGLINIAMDTALRLDQCNGLRVVIPEKEEMCFQIDGEPWRQLGPATVTIELSGHYPMLQAPHSSSAVLGDDFF